MTDVVHIIQELNHNCRAYCGRKRTSGIGFIIARRITKQMTIERYLFDDERLCKDCERTSDYGMLLLEITDTG